MDNTLIGVALCVLMVAVTAAVLVLADVWREIAQSRQELEELNARIKWDRWQTADALFREAAEDRA